MHRALELGQPPVNTRRRAGLYAIGRTRAVRPATGSRQYEGGPSFIRVAPRRRQLPSFFREPGAKTVAGRGAVHCHYDCHSLVPRRPPAAAVRSTSAFCASASVWANIPLPLVHCSPYLPTHVFLCAVAVAFVFPPSSRPRSSPSPSPAPSPWPLLLTAGAPPPQPTECASLAVCRLPSPLALPL